MMASKTTDAVNERRIRPIYDCLDTGSNKKAVHEADKVLKKQKDNLCAKALKSLAFHRMGKTEECKELVAEVLKETPSDEPTLQAMSICLRELSRADLITTMFEGAMSVKPNSEEVLSHLFMAYVRTSDFKKQKDVALQLYKVNDHTPFYLWAVMSVVMQAKSPEGEKLAKAVLLPMAERMIQKLVKEDRLKEGGDVELFLMVLELQEKYEEALLVLKGPLGTKLKSEPHQRDIKISAILKRMNRSPELCAIFRRLVLLQPDDWMWLKEYLTYVFILIESGWKPDESSNSEGQVDYTLNSAADLVNSLRNASSVLAANNSASTISADDGRTLEINGDVNGEVDVSDIQIEETTKSESKTLAIAASPHSLVSSIDPTAASTPASASSNLPGRGAILAQLEFLRQAKENGLWVEAKLLVDSPKILVLDNFRLFANKSSFFSDVKTWLPLLEKEDLKALVTELAPEVGAETMLNASSDAISSMPPETIQDLLRHLNWCKLFSYSGLMTSLSPDVRKSVVVELVSRHRDGLRFGEGLKKTEIQFSDDYLLLAAHLILSSTGGAASPLTDRVFQAIVLLENGLKASHYNYQFRLLLSRLYAKLGAFQKSMDHFENLQIKYIQYDTLSHYWLTHAVPQGHYFHATVLHNKALQFFSNTFRDTSEYLIQAYRFGSFAKIPEFLRLRERLTFSLQYSLVYVESLIYDLVLKTASHALTEERVAAMALDPVTDQTNWDLIQDNRDLRLMADWTASTLDAVEERCARNLRHEKAWAKLRHAIHHAVSAAILFASGGKEDAADSTTSPAVNDDVLPPPPSTKQKTVVNLTILRRLIKDFEDHVAFCRAEFLDKEEEERLTLIHPLYSTPPSRIFDYLKFGHALDILLDSLKLAEYIFSFPALFAEKKFGKDILNEKMETLLEKRLLESFQAMFEVCLSSTLSTGGRDDDSETRTPTTKTLQHDHYLHNFSVAIETLSLVVALIGSCHKVLRPLKNSLTKKAKKKKGGGADGASSLPQTFANFTTAVTSLRDEAAKFGQQLDRISEQLAMSDVGLGAGMRKLSIVDESKSNGVEQQSVLPEDILIRINESYVTSSTEMATLVSKKVSYLTSLLRL